MIKRILLRLFSCNHKNVSRPIRNHRVCIDCGLEMNIDKDNPFEKKGNWYRRKV